MKLSSLLFVSICFFSSSVFADDEQEASLSIEDEMSSAGQVTINGQSAEVVNEFRINGQLYMIRITPRKGVPYYLVDSDGDGNLETRWNELASDLLIPSWVLLRW